MKTAASLETMLSIEGVKGFLDFRGNHHPCVRHANHAVMHEYFARNKEELSKRTNVLNEACRKHYDLPGDADILRNTGMTCWRVV